MGEMQLKGRKKKRRPRIVNQGIRRQRRRKRINTFFVFFFHCSTFFGIECSTLEIPLEIEWRIGRRKIPDDLPSLEFSFFSF